MVNAVVHDLWAPLTSLQDNGMTKLEKRFAKKVHHPMLQPLLPVIQGLMRFLPSNRISVEEALELLESGCTSVKTSDCRVS